MAEIISMMAWLRDHDEPIIAQHVFPPIPIRDFDWCAYRDPEVTPYGYGRTKEEAVHNLLELEDDYA